MNIKTITCAREKCGYSPFPMEVGYNARCHRTGETFLCPSGHPNYYIVGPTADEKEITRLRRRLQEEREYASELLDRIKDLRRTCQWPLCGFVSASQGGVKLHMQRIHGVPSLVELADVEAGEL